MKSLLIILFLLTATPTYAQIGFPVVIPGMYLTWDMTDSTAGPFYPATAAIAKTLVYKYFADGSLLGIAINGITCIDNPPASPFLVTCKALFPKFTAGNHKLAMTVRDATVESELSMVFEFTYRPSISTVRNIRAQ